MPLSKTTNHQNQDFFNRPQAVGHQGEGLENVHGRRPKAVPKVQMFRQFLSSTLSGM